MDDNPHHLDGFELNSQHRSSLVVEKPASSPYIIKRNRPFGVGLLIVLLSLEDELAAYKEASESSCYVNHCSPCEVDKNAIHDFV